MFTRERKKKIQQSRRRSLYNGLGLPENDYRHNSANAGRYMAVGTSHTSGYAEGGVILDFADPTRHFFREKHDSENVDKFRCDETRYSRDYTYECFFRQTGSVSTQGESSRNNLGGEEQLRLTPESVYTFSCAMRDDPTSYLEGCSMGDEYTQRNFTKRGPVILDFENYVGHLPLVTGVSSGFQVANVVDMLANQNDYPPNVDCLSTSLFGDTNFIHISDELSRNNLNSVSTGFQFANDVDMLASKNNYSPNVDHLGSPLFGDINSIHSNGRVIIQSFRHCQMWFLHQPGHMLAQIVKVLAATAILEERIREVESDYQILVVKVYLHAI
nr:hypothetical protein [Tanacetum cinerariifolium]